MQQAAEASIGAARGHHLAPGADRRLDRRQRPPHDDGGGNHDAGRYRLGQRQQRADAQHRYLQAKPAELRHGLQYGGAVAGAPLQGNAGLVPGEPALAQAGRHAHGVHCFGVALASLAHALRRGGSFRRFAEHLPGCQLGQQGQREQQQGAAQRDRAEQRMAEQDHGYEKRREGHVEEGQEPGAGKEPAQALEVAHDLAVAGGRGAEPACQHRLEQPCVQRAVETQPDTHQDARPQRLQQGVRQQQATRQQGQHQQRVLAVRVQDPVIDLHHVDRHGQQQQIDYETEHADREEAASRQPERGL